jgi:hypothetical protein
VAQTFTQRLKPRWFDVTFGTAEQLAEKAERVEETPQGLKPGLILDALRHDQGRALTPFRAGGVFFRKL